MKTKVQGACGVWIEFLDRRGNTVAQHVIDEWHGRPVPDRGDRFELADVVGVRKHRGIVIGRRFDLQHSPEGEPQLWVRLVVRVEPSPSDRFAQPRSPTFSLN